MVKCREVREVSGVCCWKRAAAAAAVVVVVVVVMMEARWTVVNDVRVKDLVYVVGRILKVATTKVFISAVDEGCPK